MFHNYCRNMPARSWSSEHSATVGLINFMGIKINKDFKDYPDSPLHEDNSHQFICTEANKAIIIFYSLLSKNLCNRAYFYVLLRKKIMFVTSFRGSKFAQPMDAHFMPFPHQQNIVVHISAVLINKLISIPNNDALSAYFCGRGRAEWWPLSVSLRNTSYFCFMSFG